MVGDTLGPFSCPAQACRRDGVAPEFENTKRFYLHWNSAHKPRCPRTDCPYNSQDLSKPTKWNFVRHWSTHFPELAVNKSACGKCQKLFPNASDRDRHAAKCEGGAAAANRSSTSSRELEIEDVAGPNGQAAPDLHSEEWIETIADPNHASSLPHTLLMSSIGDSTSSGTCPGELSFEQAVTIPTFSSQLVNPFASPTHDFTAFDQMHPSSPLQHLFPHVAQGQRAFGRPQEANAPYTGSRSNHGSNKHSLRPVTVPEGTPSMSRKRANEDSSVHASKRHRSSMENVGNVSASFSCTETHLGIAGSGQIPFAGASGGTMFYEIDTVLEPVIPDSETHIPEAIVLTNGNDAISSSSKFASIRPRASRKPHTQFECISHSTTVSSSPHVEAQKRIVAVKTTLSFIGGRQETTRDLHTWIRKLTHKRRKTADTTSLRVNDILVSKKTRYPRVRTH